MFDDIFVIAGRIKGEDKIKFLAVEYGYFWTHFMGPGMCRYKTYEDAAKVFESAEFQKCDITSDGTKYPPRALHYLSKTNKKMEEDVEVFILKIDFQNMYKAEYHCEIKKPTKVIYEYD